MEAVNSKLFYVGVQFRNSLTKYSYICTDLTVKVGDQVVVPVLDGQELQATVVTAQFYSPDEVPYPIEKTKRVIRKVEPEQEKAEEKKTVTVVGNEAQTETADDKLYYLGVKFLHGYNVFPYICTDLSVKVGDQVLVPLYSGERSKAIVVTAQFYSPDEVPHPVEMTLKVIRKVELENEKTKEAKPVSVLKNTATRAPVKTQAVTPPRVVKKPRRRSASDVLAAIFTLLLAVPFFTMVFGLIVSVILSVLGWRSNGDGAWLPMIIGFPLAVYACVRSLKKVDFGGSTERGTYYKNAGRSGGADGGWYPGCPEDKAFSSNDNLFDYDGDGHLDAFESASRYDSFFGDDE